MRWPAMHLANCSLSKGFFQQQDAFEHAAYLCAVRRHAAVAAVRTTGHMC